VHFAESCCIVALGIGIDGVKRLFMNDGVVGV